MNNKKLLKVLIACIAAVFFACAVTVAVPLIIEAVKKRRIKARAYGEEDYLI